MRYIVVGATGQVGQEFSKCLAPDKLVALGHEEIEVTRPESVRDALDLIEGDIVVDLAAFHNVNQCEDDPDKAFRVNAIGARHIAEAAADRGCKVVYFSSDYVFGLDAMRESPYLESDSINPVNTYGASKAAGEHLVRSVTANHLIVRTSSLFGVVTSKKGWTFPEMILKKARSREDLKVVNDQYMSPTYTLDLVQAVVQLIQNDATGTIHLTNGGGCTWYEFATETLIQSEVDYPVKPVGSDAFPARARRPSYSRLDSERLECMGIQPLRGWREALNAYLDEKAPSSRPGAAAASGAGCLPGR
jgi:dTDP-4-dehydrorhamnose reductase